MEVILHVYDLSGGMARAMSQSMLGFHVDAVYHTGVVAFGREYFYGGGIQRMDHDAVVRTFGLTPVEKISLGTTSKTQEEFHDFLESIKSDFTPEKYDLFHNNCNNFSDRAAKFLLEGRGIPEHIVELPSRVLDTPLGKMIAPMYQGMQQRMQNEMIPFNQTTSSSVEPSNSSSTANNASASGAPTAAPKDSPSLSSLSLGKEAEAEEAESAEAEGIELRVKISTQESPVKPKVKSMMATVGELKRALARVSDYAADDQRLIFKGQFLKDDDKTLTSYNILESEVIHMVPKPGAAKKSASAASSDTSKPSSPLDIALAKLNEAPAKERLVALKTLQKIVQNLIDYPLEAKYRKIKRENKALTKRLAIPGAMECLLSLGFKEDADADTGEQLLVLEASAEAWQKVVDGNEKLTTLVESQQEEQKAPSSQAQSSSGAGSSQNFGGAMPFGNPFAGFPMPSAGNGGMGDAGINSFQQQMMQSLLSNPEMMRSMLQMPHIQQMAQNNPMMAHALREIQENPEHLRNMMNNPVVQSMMQNPDMARSFMNSMGGMPTSMPGGMPGGANPFNMGMGGSGGTNSSNGNGGNGSGGGNDSQMTEEEMIEEAIRRSLQEQ
mmetsp:Transcript_8822/g.17446  ORF Transcript_8822/g.17446 Transcript_8822/m.17446 type:complete len:610 (-) Transcript_8822:325-2154(-)|eukprot:CAMPEP_0171493252 /NCGR_PEP_ID=MMETSP0958-20121227/4862_1 /TAXON_ID=87120 /ORGANISM="Aurantiochytrium limacinum, Strain ATCCMYA-1381" /LENGTH=609 /DNA_ID=CAMNT_0012026861 /DNA_START=126 /DNA_END=1955 /DNA_ORIENTATION=-